MQQAAAGGPRPRKPQAEGAAPGQQQQHPQRQGQQQEGQQRSGGKGVRGSEGGAPEPLELSEASPMYLPVLTDEDLDNDPPGHKSGYVAVIGRPNAGEDSG
jgi:GTP-binding protein Era